MVNTSNTKNRPKICGVNSLGFRWCDLAHLAESGSKSWLNDLWNSGLEWDSMGVHGWWDIFWLNYGNSITWKYLLSYGHLGMIPRILSIIPMTSQWGHYDSCRWMDVNSGDLPQGQVGVLWSALISALLITHHTLHCRQPRIAISLRFLIVTTNFSIIQESQVWECKVELNIMLRCYIMIDTGVTKFR